MTPQEIASIIATIESKVIAADRDKRKAVFHNILSELPDEVKRLAIPLVSLTIISEQHQKDMAANAKTLQLYGFLSGIIFVLIGLILLWVTPTPTPIQYWVARVVISLGAAGFALVLAGAFQIQAALPLITITAAGSLGILLLIYLVNPPSPPAATPTATEHKTGK